MMTELFKVLTCALVCVTLPPLLEGRDMERMVFPGTAWEEASPASLGVDGGKLKEKRRTRLLVSVRRLQRHSHVSVS